MAPHEDDLPLPPLDDGDEAPQSGPEIDPTLQEEEGDLMDDGELGGTADELVSELQTIGDDDLLEGSEDAGDMAGDDEPPDFSGPSLIGEDEALGVDGEDFGLNDGDALALDAGDEGFEGEEEFDLDDLPDLDADEEGDLDDPLDLPLTQASEAPLWDDRAWDKVTGPLAIGDVEQLWLEGGTIVALVGPEIVVLSPAGTIVRRAPRPDVVPEPPSVRKRPAIADATACVSYANGAVGAVRETVEERTWLLRTSESGPRIVADVTDDAGDERAHVAAIVVEPTRGCVWVGGNFGLLAYRPRTR